MKAIHTPMGHHSEKMISDAQKKKPAFRQTSTFMCQKMYWYAFDVL